MLFKVESKFLVKLLRELAFIIIDHKTAKTGVHKIVKIVEINPNAVSF